MKKEKLNSILISLESGGRPKGGAIESGISSIGAEHLNDDGTVKTDIKKFVPEDYFNKLKTGIIKKEDILIVKDGATTGKVSFINKDYPLNKVAVNEHVFIIRIDQNKAFPKYVFNYLRSVEGQKEILSDFRGATVGGISRKIGEVVLVPLPPLEEQKHIAAVLSKAEALIAERKQSIQLLDEYLKSTFLEMFGDPVKNEKGWEIQALAEVTIKVTDGEHLNPNIRDIGKHILMAKDIQEDKVDFSQNKFVSEIDFEKFTKKCKPEFGDLLLVSRGATIGRCVSLKSTIPFCLMGSVILIKPNSELLNSDFLNYLFRNENFKKILVKTSGSSAQQAIYLNDLKKIKTINPPISLQTQFAQIVEKTEALKAQYKEHLQELEQLYGALSQRAFRGGFSKTEVKRKEKV